jgi:flagellar basal-body rod protein FlgB
VRARQGPGLVDPWEEGWMAGLFTTRTDVVVMGGLDGLAARHRAYANNIANLETPGFHPSDVPFEAQLRQIRDRLQEDPSRAGRATELSLDPVMQDQGADRVDGNGVQPDQQVTQLAESTLSYEALAQAAKMRDALLRSVVTDGRQ